MAGRTVEAMGAALSASLCRADEACATLCIQLGRLLAQGHLVSHTPLAVALHWTYAEIVTTLLQVPNVEVNEQGHIVAAGLSLLPTPLYTARSNQPGCTRVTAVGEAAVRSARQPGRRVRQAWHAGRRR